MDKSNGITKLVVFEPASLTISSNLTMLGPPERFCKIFISRLTFCLRTEHATIYYSDKDDIAHTGLENLDHTTFPRDCINSFKYIWIFSSSQLSDYLIIFMTPLIANRQYKYLARSHFAYMLIPPFYLHVLVTEILRLLLKICISIYPWLRDHSLIAGTLLFW